MDDDGSQIGEAVTLVWAEHSRLLAEGIWKSFKDKTNIDLRLKCGSDGKNLEAHLLIVSSLCPKLNVNDQLDIDDECLLNVGLDIARCEAFFKFLYTGQITIEEKQLGVLRKCAEAFKAERIVEIVDEHIKYLSRSKMDAEESAEVNSIARRKRKSTPVKLQKSNEVEMSPAADEESTVVTKRKTKPIKKEKVESETYETESEAGEEEDSDANKVEEVKSKRGPKSKKDASAATHKRTAYKRSWRMNQPLQKCPHCPYETRDKESFRSHTNRHDPTAEKFVCRFCEKTFRSKRGFARHQNIHLQPDRIHRCPLCSYLTPLRSTLSQHMGTVHRADLEGKPLTGKFKCPDCDFSCLFECQLKIHLIRKHKQERPFKCSECEYSAVLKSDLDKHVGIRHRLERPYMCEICGFRSQSQGGYNRHKRSHTGEKPFRCDQCGKLYADSRKFKIHVRRHENDEKPFTCHLCGHSCRRKDNLKMHLKRIHKTDLEGDPMVSSCAVGDNEQDVESLVLNGRGCDTLSLGRDENNRAGRQGTINCLPIPAQQPTTNQADLINQSIQQNQQSNLTLLSNTMNDTVVLFY